MSEVVNDTSRQVAALQADMDSRGRIILRAHVDPKRRAVGRRAKRQAFYNRRRTERVLNRLLRGTLGAREAAFDKAFSDFVRFGVAWIRSDKDGLTRADPLDAFYDER